MGVMNIKGEKREWKLRDSRTESLAVDIAFFQGLPGDGVITKKWVSWEELSIL